MSDDRSSEADDLDGRMPTKGDRLFIAVHLLDGVYPVTDPKERLYRLPLGYKRAADLLLEQAETSVTDRRNVIYPAIFCYRQFIELFLKRLIDEFGTQPKRNTKTHDLSRLWKDFSDLIQQRGCPYTEEFAAAKTVVDDMHQADSRSDGFRYHTDRDGNPFAFGDWAIDSGNLREVMTGLQNFFECVDLQFTAENEAASDRLLGG